MNLYVDDEIEAKVLNAAGMSAKDFGVTAVPGDTMVYPDGGGGNMNYVKDLYDTIPEEACEDEDL